MAFGLVYMPSTVMEAVTGLFRPVVGPVDPEEWARDTFGTSDPFVYWEQWKLRSTQHHTFTQDSEELDDDRAHRVLQEALEQIRPCFVDVDGSARRGDFNHIFNPVRLPMWLRLALLPDLCGLNVGGVRRWRLRQAHIAQTREERREYGYESEDICFVYVAMSTAPELARWEKAYPQIRALLGFDVHYDYLADAGVVHVVRHRQWMEHRPGEFVGWVSDGALQVVGEDEQEAPDMLPYEPLPFVPEAHPVGHLAEGWLYFGEQFVDRTKGGHWVKVKDLNNTLVMGTAGFGKSVFLNQMLEGVFFNQALFDQVLLVDLKGGVELWPYLKRGDHVRVIKDFASLAAPIAELVAEVDRRLEVMREEGHRMWPGPKTILVIDEYAQIQISPETTKEERQYKQELLTNLNRLSMLGRAAGVVIWAQLQKGTTDVMDSSFRANLANQVCFKVPNKLTAAGMFGSTDELMVDPVKLPKGRFIFYDATNGETHYLQARMIES